MGKFRVWHTSQDVKEPYLDLAGNILHIMDKTGSVIADLLFDKAERGRIITIHLANHSTIEVHRWYALEDITNGILQTFGEIQ